MAQEKRSAPAGKRRKAGAKRSLNIEVVWGGIDAVQADVLLVGHYLGVMPQTAERKLDELVSGTGSGRENMTHHRTDQTWSDSRGSRPDPALSHAR